MPAFLLALLLHAIPPRERAVMIYPTEHAWFHRLFYNGHQRELQRELAERFDLDIHDQVSTADGVYGADVRGAELLVLSGHGNPFGMSMRGRNESTLDGTQFSRLRSFLSQLAPDATIVLQSCNTGLGFAWVVKRAAGASRHVIAATGEVPRDGMHITSVSPLAVTIICKDGADCTLRL